MRRYDTHTLRRERRTLSTPFQLKLDAEGARAELTCTTLYRHLPGKRLVCAGQWEDRTPVVVKIFLDPSGAERHCLRECQGIQAMQAARISTPDLLFQGRLADRQAPLLIFRQMEGFENLSERLTRAGNAAERFAPLGAVVTSIAQLHAAGLRQRDIHAGNFLIADGTVMIIDGGDIQQSGRRPLSPRESLANLALFFAQFPSDFDEMAAGLADVYAVSRGWPPSFHKDQSLKDQIQRWRAWRLKKFLPKTQRPCTAFIVKKDWHRFMACDREWYSPTTQRLLDSPDAFIETGTILKAGNSATVARISIDSQDVVVKRYNIKDIPHALRRGLRPSRAMVSWKNAHRLRFWGIHTPRPLAVIEERWGRLRKRAYFIMAHQSGETIDQVLRAAGDAPQAIAQALEQLQDLLHRLAAARVSHGDFKATNFLLSPDGLYLLDLDGMRAHRRLGVFKRAFHRDLRRLERNWQDLPEIKRPLTACLSKVLESID